MGFNGIAKSQVLLPFVNFECLVRPVDLLGNQLFIGLMTGMYNCTSLQQEQRGEESEFCPELATAGQDPCLVRIVLCWQLLSDLILSVLYSSSSSALATLLPDTIIILSRGVDSALATILAT